MTKARFTEADLAQALTEFTRECETTVREVSQGKNGSIVERRLPGAPLRDYTPKPLSDTKLYKEESNEQTEDPAV
jgi:hypothetical protein